MLLDLSISLPAISVGGSAVLGWQATGAVFLTIDQGVGPVPLSGAMVVDPSVTTTWTGTAVDIQGLTVTSAITLVVTPAPLVASMSATPVDPGAGTWLLTWSSGNGASVT